MSAGAYDLDLIQGSTLSLPITISETGFDFSAYNARATVRSDFGGTSLLSLTITNGTRNTGTYSLTISATAAETAALTGSGTTRRVAIGVWDLEIYSGSTVRRILEGKAWLSREATT